MTFRDVHPTAARTSSSSPSRTHAADAALVFSVVFAAGLFASATRPAGFLAAIWPANALLLGLLIRHPRSASPAGWSAAFAAYVLADLATGASLYKTLLLTAGNLVSVLVGYLLYTRLQDDDRRLKRPFSVLYLTVISAIAAAASGIVGSLIHPILFNGTALEGMLFWLVSEFVNFIVVLPAALTLPALRWPTRADWDHLDQQQLTTKAAPLLALTLSCLASHWIGGPGAVAFPVPALLWCALVFNVAGTALITLLVSAWTLIGISTGLIPVGADFTSTAAIMSIRIGVALMALAPLNVASVMAARNEFQSLLQRMVTNDPMTAALNRRAFALRTRNQLRASSGAPQPLAMLLFDVDRLGHINAIHGHDMGDQVLKTLARAARAYLPHGDDLGRLGSDEFAILLFDCDRLEAAALADRVCTALSETPIRLSSGDQIHATASVGIASAIEAPLMTTERLLNAAEKALHQAKQAGGNQSALHRVTA